MPADPTEPTDPGEATGPAEPTEATEQAEPTEATEPAEPTERTSVVPDDRAVVDRIVDGATAVLLAGPDERLLELPAESLPSGATDGTWLVLDLAADPPKIVGVDQDRTAARQADAEDRLQQLRRTRSGGRFD